MKVNIKLLILIFVLVNVGLLVSIKLMDRSENKKIDTQAPVQKTNQKTTKADEQLIYKKTVITITDSGFNPNSVKVKQGMRVIWENKSGKTAAVFSDNHPTHLLYTQLNLGEVDNGSTVQLVFEEKGTFKYHNHLNPSQTGTVVVE